MQQIASISGFTDTGIELGLMPGETYHKGDPSSGRISTVLSFKVLHDRPCEVYLPVAYEAPLRSIVSKMPLSRNVSVSSAPIPQGAVSTMVTRYFDEPRVLRISLCALGEDFEERLAEEENREREVALRQVFVNLGEPWSGKAVASLRNRGFYFGGFLPLWFETDGLLMQKLSSLPDFNSVKLLMEDTRKLFDFIQDDIRGGPAHRAP
jgi:hypothetical protein